MKTPTKPKARKPFKAIHSCTNFLSKPDFIQVLCIPLDAASVEALREKVAGHIAVGITTAYLRGQQGMPVVSAYREDYDLTDAVLAALGIKPKARK